ncbi:hypothetical protein ABXN37_02025 [Piscinibacter sakaiensis]|uniref:hypothetical protein n=1 Tax=Piscinibacter sakaiensis TaxID=1547922 RepID=UPI0012FB3F8C|nr:hypothetical protein [Piscinibacter sakaiensis]
MTTTNNPSLGTVATFDIFETLIVRPLDRPDDLHYFVPFHINSANITQRPESRSWQKVRVRAERAARKSNPHREITLSDIYKIIQEISDNNIEIALDALMEAEKLAEVCVAKPIEASWQRLMLARTENRVIAYASDMYLPMRTVRTVLKCSPQYRDDDDVFLSSELGCRKSDGSMFKHIAKTFGLPFGKMSHLGDNKMSDISIPRQLGVNAEHCSAVRYLRFEKEQSEARVTTQPGLSYAAIGRAVRLSLPVSSPVSVRQVASSVVAPLASALALFTLRTAERQKCDKVLFLARDGFIVSEVAKEFIKHERMACDAHYFYTSRAALDEVINSVDGSECVIRFKEYIVEELGLTSDSRILIQDLGWKGSIQARLLKCLLKVLGKFEDCQLFGTYLGLKEDPPAKSGQFFALCTDSQWINSSLVEALFSAGHASFDSYKRQRSVRALRLDDHDLTLKFSHVHLQASVDYASTLTRLLKGLLPLHESIHSELCEIGLLGLEILQRTPSLCEAVVYGGIQHASNSDHGNTTHLGGRIGMVQLAQQLLKKGAVSSTHWPQASILVTMSTFRMGIVGQAVNFARARLANRRCSSPLSIGFAASQ